MFNGPYPNKNDTEFMKNSGCSRVPQMWFPEGEKKTRKMAWEEGDMGTLPDNFDWRNVEGRNYLSWNKN